MYYDIGSMSCTYQWARVGNPLDSYVLGSYGVDYKYYGLLWYDV